MENFISFNSRYVDAQNFSQNAAKQILKVGPSKLVEFLDALGYPVRPDKKSGGFYGVCPVCRSQNCYIGTNGKAHTVYWRCLDKSGACPSNGDVFKTPRNLLSLVKFILGTQKAAFKAMATFLGCEDRPFDITNGKLDEADGYTFVVADEGLAAKLRGVGAYAITFDGNFDDPSLRRKYLICVLDESIARRFETGTNVVIVHSPTMFEGLTGLDLKKRAQSIMRVAMFQGRRP